MWPCSVQHREWFVQTRIVGNRFNNRENCDVKVHIGFASFQNRQQYFQTLQKLLWHAFLCIKTFVRTVFEWSIFCIYLQGKNTHGLQPLILRTSRFIAPSKRTYSSIDTQEIAKFRNGPSLHLCSLGNKYFYKVTSDHFPLTRDHIHLNPKQTLFAFLWWIF